MKTVLIKDCNGTEVGTIDIDDKILAKEITPSLLKQAVVMYHANKRLGTAKTKTRGEVKGSGKKPYAQKHTGRARAGTFRSPLWRKGGIVFGPQPRDYSFSMPKKAVREALLEAIRSKFADGEAVIVDNLSLPKPKTKEIVKILKNLGIKETCLIAVGNSSQNVYKSARNIPGVEVMRVQDLNALTVLKYRKFLLTKEAAEHVISQLSAKSEEKNK